MANKHTFRYLKSTTDGVQEVEETKKLSAKQAIRYYCLDCSGGNIKEVHRCILKMCPLWCHRPISKAVSK